MFIRKSKLSKKKKQPEIIKTLNRYSQATVIGRKNLGGKTTKMQAAAEVRTARGQKHLDKSRPLEDLKVVEVAS